MLREKDNIEDALIHLLQSLPDSQQERILKTVGRKKKTGGGRKVKSYRAKANELIAAMKKTRGRLPENYKFDREEANER